jgi:hypothetical protein
MGSAGKAFMLIGASLCAGPTALCARASQNRQLGGGDIRIALFGKLIAYEPAGSADAGIHEEFRKGGLWQGIYYSRGPVRFSGRWMVQGDQLCVLPDRRAIVALWFDGRRCRSVWRAGKTGRLLIEHLSPRFASLGPLPVVIRELHAIGH